MHGPPRLVAWRWPPTPTAVMHKQVNLGRLSSWFMLGVGGLVWVYLALHCDDVLRESEREKWI